MHIFIKMTLPRHEFLFAHQEHVDLLKVKYFVYYTMLISVASETNTGSIVSTGYHFVHRHIKKEQSQVIYLNCLSTSHTISALKVVAFS